MEQLISGTVDTQKQSTIALGNTNAGDNTIIELTIKSNGVLLEYDNPTFELLAKKSDNTRVRQIKDITLEEGKIKIKCDIQLVLCEGLVTNQLYITDGDRISTVYFYFNVNPSLENEVLEESKDKIESLDKLDQLIGVSFDNLEEYEKRLLEFSASMTGIEEAESKRNANELIRSSEELARSTSEEVRINSEEDRVIAENERVANEQERQLSEEDRITNENNRRLAENTRKSQENSRVQAEAERQGIFEENENIRKEQEAKRVQAESTREEKNRTWEEREGIRLISEDQRRESEEARQLAETERDKSEKLREQQENNRQLTYNKFNADEEERISNENIRKTQEDSRNKAELLRQQQEEKRVSAENTRNDSYKASETNRENTFIENENRRQSSYESAELNRNNTFDTEEIKRKNSYQDAENTRNNAFEVNEANRQNEYTAAERLRVENENLRKNNEVARGSNEDERKNNENLRNQSENSRVEEEKARVLAEGKRVEAEQTRVNEFNTMKLENETFKQGINEQYEDIVTEFDKVIANVTNGNENATNSEIVQARGKEVNLNARLDNFDEQLDTKASKNEVFTMANMGQDVKEAMTGGSVAVVGKNAVLRENVCNNSISPNKTSFLIHDNNTNIVDKNLVTYGYYVNPNNGVLVAKEGWYVTDFLEIESGINYYSSGLYGGYCAGYDSGLNFVKGWDESAPLAKNFTIQDENIKYLRFTILNDDNLLKASLSSIDKNKNECSYKLNKIKIFNDDISGEINGDKISNSTIYNSKLKMMEFNLNDIQFSENKYVLIANGELYDYNEMYASDFVDVGMLSSVTIINYSKASHLEYLNNLGVVFYDVDKKRIGSIPYDKTNNMTINLSNECAFIRFTSVQHEPSNIKLYINRFIDRHREKISQCEERINIAEDDILKIKAEIGQDIVNPTDYKGTEVTIFNKCLCIGDSLTAGVFNHNETGNVEYIQISKYSYPTYFTKICGVETVNWGMGGNTTKSWYEAKKDTNWGGYDFAIINLGTNDAKITVAESKEYLIKIVEKLKAENNNIKIFIATLLPAYYTTNAQFFEQINNNMKEVVSLNNNCYLIDLSTYSECKNGTVYAQGHLTALGYLKEATELIAYISYIISQNKEEFKFVHFIGTNYSHS